MRSYVYILSNKHRTTFYIGSTTDLYRRLMEHRRGKGDAFTSKYNLTHLMYFEKLPSICEARAREKQLKNWHRGWKINLIMEKNPELRDLSAEILRKSDAETSSASARRKQESVD